MALKNKKKDKNSQKNYIWNPGYWNFLEMDMLSLQKILRGASYFRYDT